jgi:sec-independent protein translocase protein TatB
MRNMANDARSEVTKELGPELDGLNLREINPRALMRKHFLDGFEDDDDRTPTRAQQTPRLNPEASAPDAPYDPDTT